MIAGVREMNRYLKVIGQLLQTTLEIFTALHQVFDIVYARKVCPQQLKKVAFFCWHWTAREDLEEVPKIVSTIIIVQKKSCDTLGKKRFLETSTCSFRVKPQSWCHGG